MINGASAYRYSANFPHLLFAINSVISGFNTDVEFDGTAYHVQTEDKGLPSRLIVSLVYDKGTILASKRADYNDLAGGEIDLKVLAERVGRQHKLICAAVKAGRMKDLQAMTAKTAANLRTASVARDEMTAAEPVLPSRPARIQTDTASSPPIFKTDDTAHIGGEFQSDPFAGAPVIDPVKIIEDNEVLHPDAVAVIEVLETPLPMPEKLRIELINDVKFSGGERRTVNIMICRGAERRVVGDAQIMIKVLGSAFRPVIFHARSDANGLARIHLQLPHFQAGRAALLVRAISGGEEIELRRVVTPG